MARDETEGKLGVDVPNVGGEWQGPEAEAGVEDFVEAKLGLEVLQAFGRKSRGRGASKPPLAFEVTRELNLDDALVMQNAPARKQGEAGAVANLQRLRTIHHQIARMVAGGEKHVNISRILGITPERIHQLTKDPAFVELMEHYKGLEEVAELSLKHRFYLLGTSGMEELQERLMDAPDSFGNGHLMDLVKLTVGGEAPKSDTGKAGGGRSLSEDELTRLKDLSDSRSRSTVTYRQPQESSDAQTQDN